MVVVVVMVVAIVVVEAVAVFRGSKGSSFLGDVPDLGIRYLVGTCRQ